jgi:glutamate formiminotransferase/formiminotetrahydrofolate cyclodeaminase
METALASLEPNKALADIGNPASGPDAGVGALCARPAVMGEFLNARINCAGLKDKAYVRELVARGQEIERQAQELERTILAIVQAKL